MRVIATEADIADGLAALVAADPRLAPVLAVAGRVPLRRAAPGFAGLARVVIGQQVSIASAEAIWSRFAAAFPAPDPAAVAASGDERLRAIGLSGAKIAALRAVAEAEAGGLDLGGLADLPGAAAHARLTAIRGIGPWTADVYLLFCLGHPDVFPAGDLALRHAVADAFDARGPMPIRELAKTAESWSPWRAVAARLFWAYYRARRNIAAAPL
ncbi:MAG: DNA-3-methyladenine glycosylase 2 family protein [Bauldia sp.]|nr:DNA-3-methyladenine glycosylase 2 family protein [Bauldia sp.]